MMKHFECVYKGNIYTCEINDCIYGGSNVAVFMARQGREPKAIHQCHVSGMFEAMMAMEKYLPEAAWKEKSNG